MARRRHYQGLEPARSSCESVISRPIKDPSSELRVANPGLGLGISLGAPGPAPEPTAAQRPRPSPRSLSPCQLSTCCSQWTLPKIPPPCQPPQLPTPPWCARNVIGSILSRPSANSSGWEARYSATLSALVGRTLLVPTPLHPVQRLEGFMHCYSRLWVRGCHKVSWRRRTEATSANTWTLPTCQATSYCCFPQHTWPEATASICVPPSVG